VSEFNTAFARTLLLTGLPRSGTTLCCHILNQSPNVLALHEPITPRDLSTKPAEAVVGVQAFVLETRASVLGRGVAMSRHQNGVVPDNPVGQVLSERGLRAMTVELGQIEAKGLDQDFTLVVKQNALFTALLPVLPFTCYAVVRNPLAVLASWNQVDLPVQRGRIPAGERYDSELLLRLEGEADRLERQLIILEWFFQRFAADVPATHILRYETFVADPACVPKVMALPCGSASVRESRNASYDIDLVRVVYERLMSSDRQLWQFYSRAAVAELFESMQGGG